MSEQKVYLISHHKTESEWKVQHTPRAPIEYGPDFYKIGISNEPKKRLSRLSGGSPHTLRLQSVIESDDAKRVEEVLHRIYKPMKHSGEWFSLLPNAANSLVALDRINQAEIEAVGGYSPDWLLSDGSNLYLEIMNHRSTNNQ